jgi:hypothetical protein
MARLAPLALLIFGLIGAGLDAQAHGSAHPSATSHAAVPRAAAPRAAAPARHAAHLPPRLLSPRPSHPTPATGGPSRVHAPMPFASLRAPRRAATSSIGGPARYDARKGAVIGIAMGRKR